MYTVSVIQQALQRAKAEAEANKPHTALVSYQDTTVVPVVEDSVRFNLRTTPKRTEDPLDVLEDELNQVSLEDTVLCGTTGELALRLIAAVSNRYYTPGNLEEQAKLVFLGYKVWSFSTWEPKRRDPLTHRLVSTARDQFDTVASKSAIETAIGCAPFKVQILGEGRYNLLRSTDTSTAVWITSDGSACGVGINQSLINSLEAVQLQRQLLVFDSSEWPSAATILRSLVYIRDYGSYSASKYPYLDLRVGAVDPLIHSGILGGYLCVENSITTCLATAGSPSEFIQFLLGLEDPPTSSSEPIEDFDLVLGELPMEPIENSIIGYGYYYVVRESLGDSAKFVKLTHTRIWMLFGPPIHVLAPEPKVTSSSKPTRLKDLCRFYPDAPHLAVPAQLDRSNSSDRLALRLLEELVGTEWTISVTPDRPGAYHKVPNRLVGNLDTRLPSKKV